MKEFHHGHQYLAAEFEYLCGEVELQKAEIKRLKALVKELLAKNEGRERIEDPTEYHG